MEKAKNKRKRAILIVVLAVIAVGLCVFLAVRWRGALIQKVHQDFMDKEFYDSAVTLSAVLRPAQDDPLQCDYEKAMYLLTNADAQYPNSSYAQAHSDSFFMNDDSLRSPAIALWNLRVLFGDREVFYRYCGAVGDAFDMIAADPYSTEGYIKLAETYRDYEQDHLSQSSSDNS